MKPSRCLTLFAILMVVGSAASALPPGSLEARLARQPQPWSKPVHRLTHAEYEATLQYWTRTHPNLIRTEKRGVSHEGMAVHLLRITDGRVPDVDKQVVLVTALHGGPERSGSTTCLRLVEWLLGETSLAEETRRRQVVLIMPIPNPHAFFVSDRWGNKEGVDLYDPQSKWWNLDDPKRISLSAPDKTPELAAVLSVVDEYRPEKHFDLHGVGLQAFSPAEMPNRTIYEGMTMFEVSACSYSNCALRPWDPRVTEAMVRAGQAAGYGSDRAEADAQRTLWIPDLEPFSDHLWVAARAGRFRSPFYGYLKYHTMISTTEIGWEASGVARVAGVLALGNATWVDERVPGYPVNRVKSRAGRFITAYGRSAAERRASRVELWQAQDEFVDGILYPEHEGRATYVCAVTESGSKLLDPNPARFTENLRRLATVNADAIAAFVAAGPEVKWTADPKRTATSARIQHGIGFRFRVPYRSPELLDVSVNGHSLRESATDGYEAWLADGYTQVQINLPPERSREMDLFVVTCAYKSNERRSHGFTPPDEVLKELKGTPR